MILPQTHLQCLLLAVLSLVCLGSWVMTLNFSKRRFELYYIDFALGLLVASAVYACTVGYLGFDGFDVVDDLMHAAKRPVLYAFTAGMMFNLGNMLMVAAASVAGIAFAFPVALGCSALLGAGVLQLARRNYSPWFLAGGILLIGAAILVNAWIAVSIHAARESMKKGSKRPGPLKPILLAIAGGIMMSTFFVLIPKARTPEIGLGPYAITVVMAVGIFLSTLVLSLFFMNLPVEGEPLEIQEIFKGKPGTHLLGTAGGALWATGTLAGLTLAAASPEIQLDRGTTTLVPLAAPLIAAFCGLRFRNEHKGAPAHVRTLTLLMFVLFGCGIALLSYAPVLLRQG